MITYQVLLDINGDGELELVYNSHRVTKVVEDINGNLHFVTQGDNNGSEDLDPIFESHVIGVWNGKVTKNLGGIIDGAVKFLKSGVGFFLFIVLPCFAFLVYEIYKFVGVMTEYRTQEALQDRVKFQEEALAAARKQLEEEAKQKELEDKKEA